ncbi:MAG TPA: serine/threonine-protein kinase, partial [Nitrospiria bacterium]|nr:serine/threonine-protein kinase [Nitrospiria bacterium]
MEFKEVKELARGGMSVVYEAFSESLGRPVVLKKIHPALASDPGFSGRLEQEAAILSGLSHPGIVGFLGARKNSKPIPVIGSDSLPVGSFFLILEKIDGASLEKIAGKEGPLSVDKGMLLFGGICKALAYLHERDVFHLDLNPSNILTRLNGEPVLADFGLSILQGEKGRTLPLDFKPATLAYLSPEEAAGLPGDGKSDLFALGMTFYYLLEGRGYFDGESPASIWRRLVYDVSRFDLRFSRPVPGYFREILQRMVSRHPE